MTAYFYIGLTIGLFIGFCAGIFGTGLMACAKRGDNQEEEDIAQWQSINSPG